MWELALVQRTAARKVVQRFNLDQKSIAVIGWQAVGQPCRNDLPVAQASAKAADNDVAGSGDVDLIQRHKRSGQRIAEDVHAKSVGNRIGRPQELRRQRRRDGDQMIRMTLKQLRGYRQVDPSETLANHRGKQGLSGQCNAVVQLSRRTAHRGLQAGLIVQLLQNLNSGQKGGAFRRVCRQNMVEQLQCAGMVTCRAQACRKC